METKNEFVIDGPTPQNSYLIPKYKKSFAFKTMNTRAPVIITKLIDYLSREMSTLEKKLGPDSGSELKQAIGELSKLKYELETSKPLSPLESSLPDVKQWNIDIEDKKREYDPLTYYTGNWLFTECYFYRRITEVFASLKTIKDYDPYDHQKTDVLEKSIPGIVDFMKELAIKKYFDPSRASKKEGFDLLLKNALWANRIDLCLSGGSTDHNFNVAKEIVKWEAKMLANDIEKVYPVLSNAKGTKVVDYVLDNTGYELMSDLIFADYMIKMCEVKVINFHVKPIPWFVSDATPTDVVTTIQRMSQIEAIQDYTSRWKKYLETGQWRITGDYFWVLGLPYTRMPEIDPRLYKILQQATLVIFKGDLNYRKLVQDMNWVPSVTFAVSLGKFRPAPLVALRTCKADTISGLNPGVAEKAQKESETWLVSGEYAVIQFDAPPTGQGV